jgi:hypothetical protein
VWSAIKEEDALKAGTDSATAMVASDVIMGSLWLKCGVLPTASKAVFHDVHAILHA